MKVKTVDIAKRMGLSKATVSLALNNKPGVSEATRQQILACKEQMEQEENSGAGSGGNNVNVWNTAGEISRTETGRGVNPHMTLPGTAQIDGYIKVVIALGKNGIIREDKMNLWSDVNTRFDSIAKEWGLAAEVGYFDIQKDSLDALLAGCNRSAVRGVIVTGTELNKEDGELFRGIRKPVVIFDADLGDGFPCVVIDNLRGTERLVEYLADLGKRDIVYLSSGTDAYNFIQRRTGFSNAMFRMGQNPVGRILTVGSQMESICSMIQAYLQEHPLPEVFLTENYLLSMGIIRTCRQMGIRIPEDVGVAGIDEVPPYMLDDYELTSLRVPHGERAAWTMMALWKEMMFPERLKASIYVNCEILEGNTVLVS